MRPRIVPFLLLLLGSPLPLAAWGFAGHRLVNRKAIETLPAPLRELFAGNALFLAEHSIDPDLWREAGLVGEGPNHYLDLDAFGVWPFPGLPRREAEHLAKHGPEARERGRLPWRAAEVYRDLVEAFRAKDHARVLERAAVLGHYVGDAHVPLHAVLNYDGQLSEQPGAHARWESEMVDRLLQRLELEVQPGPAQAGAEPEALVFEALLESFTEAGAALASDKASVRGRDLAETPEDERYDDAYYQRLFEREGPRVRARLTKATQRLGALWLSAYAAAGNPSLDARFRIPYVRGQTKLILASLDGAAAPVIDEAVRRGLMPHLAALRTRGGTARGSVTSWPAKTASGHATLFTGTGPDRHGIAGNKVHLPGESLLEAVSGYRSEGLRAEPLWVTAARQGLRATMLCSTQDYPFDPYQEGKRFGGNFGTSLTFLTGYKGPWLEDAAYRGSDLPLRAPTLWKAAPPGSREVEMPVGASRLFGLVFDDPQDPVRGFDTLLLSINKDATSAARLKPLAEAGPEAFVPVSVTLEGHDLPVYFRLFSLLPDGSDLLLYRSRAGLLLSNHEALLPAATRETGGFVGNGASALYERGDLGPPLFAGGDGTAERRYLETVRLVERQFERLLDFGATRTQWDVLVGYLPFPDEFLHLWWGHLDPSLSGYDPVLARRLGPFLDEGLRIADAYVGALLRHAGKDVVLALGTDHGMTSVRTRVRVNGALRDAGLLALDAQGRIDLEKTRAFYEEAGGQVLLNRTSRASGIVSPAQEEGVLEDVRNALRRVVDPKSGQALVTEILDPARRPELGGPHGGDLSFRLAPGVFPTGEATGAIVYEAAPQGEHLLEPERPDLHGIFVVAGPGVAKGRDLGVVHQIDIAPTLAELLGLLPPAQTSGRVLREALAPLAR